MPTIYFVHFIVITQVKSSRSKMTVYNAILPRSNDTVRIRTVLSGAVLRTVLCLSQRRNTAYFHSIRTPVYCAPNQVSFTDRNAMNLSTVRSVILRPIIRSVYGPYRLTWVETHGKITFNLGYCFPRQYIYIKTTDLLSIRLDVICE